MENIEYLLYMLYVVSSIQEKQLHLYDKPLHKDLKKPKYTVKKKNQNKCKILPLTTPCVGDSLERSNAAL